MPTRKTVSVTPQASATAQRRSRKPAGTPAGGQFAEEPPKPKAMTQLTLDDEPVPVKDDGPVVFGTEQIALLERFARLRAKAKALEAEADKIGDLLKDYMNEAEEGVSPDGEIVATYRRTKVTRVDTTALKRELPDIAKRYEVTSERRTFLVKLGED